MRLTWQKNLNFFMGGVSAVQHHHVMVGGSGGMPPQKILENIVAETAPCAFFYYICKQKFLEKVLQTLNFFLKFLKI
jgi:hypothetical protein